jgi:hypothetical protein
VGTDLFNILGCRRYITALASCAILNEDQVPAGSIDDYVLWTDEYGLLTVISAHLLASYVVLAFDAAVALGWFPLQNRIPYLHP